MNNVPQIEPGGDSTAVDLVASKFTLATGYATTAFSLAMDFLTDIKNIVANLPTVNVDDVILDNVDFHIDFNVEDLITNRPVNNVVDDIIVPTNLFTYNEDPYVSSLLDALKTKLYNMIIFGEGLGADIEQALIDRETERDRLINQDAKDKIADELSKRGLEMPDGEIFNAFAQVETEYQNKRLDKSREIAVESRKIALDNLRFALEQTKALEGTLMEYTGKSWERKLQAAKELMNGAIATFNAMLERYKGRIELYKTEADVYKASADAAAAIMNAKVSEIRARLEYALGKVNLAIQKITARLKELELKYGLNLEATKAGAGLAAQIAASSLSSISAAAHIQYGHTDSHQSSIAASEQWSHSEDITPA